MYITSNTQAIAHQKQPMPIGAIPPVSRSEQDELPLPSKLSFCRCHRIIES